MPKQAIDGKRENAFARDPESLTIVGYDNDEGSEVSGYDERVETIDETITDDWVDNIARLGVIETVLVRKNGLRVDVVAGRRRVLGARKANKKRAEAGEPPILVSCMVWKGTDKVAFETMASENIGRVDDTPVTLARKMVRYQQLHKATDRDLMVVFQMPLPKIKQHLALLDLSDKVQEHVSEGRLGVHTALTLRDLPRSEQDVKATEFVAAGVTVHEARQTKKVRKAKKEGRAVDDSRALPLSNATCAKLSVDEEFIAGLSLEARHLLQAITGYEPARARVKGLVAALRRMEGA